MLYFEIVQQVKLKEASQYLLQLFAAANRGEIVLITSDDQTVVRLVAVKPLQ